jgi:hypothetical protein
MLPVLPDTVDQRSPVALLYTERRPIGVGRLRRLASDSGVADVAVTVADEWHGRGAGNLLAREVLARAGNVREIQTVVCEDNSASLRIARPARRAAVGVRKRHLRRGRPGESLRGRDARRLPDLAVTSETSEGGHTELS